MTIIVAMDKNQAIGRDNQLLWHLPDDLKRFKSLTQGHTVVMGRKTFESLGKPLPNRTNIVISSNEEYLIPENVIVCNSLEDALNIAKENDENPYVIGGGLIYKQALNLVDRLEVTLVDTKITNADTYFPLIDFSKWKKIHDQFHPKDEKHLYDFNFLTFKRLK